MVGPVKLSWWGLAGSEDMLDYLGTLWEKSLLVCVGLLADTHAVDEGDEKSDKSKHEDHDPNVPTKAQGQC